MPTVFLYLSLLIPVIIALLYTTSDSNQPMNSLRKHVLLGSGKRTAVLIGATGATGSQVLKLLLNSPEWGKITTFGRRELPDNSFGPNDKSKLQHHTVNFDTELNAEDDKIVSMFQGHDVCLPPRTKFLFLYTNVYDDNNYSE
jgi:hypothetical protein